MLIGPLRAQEVQGRHPIRHVHDLVGDAVPPQGAHGQRNVIGVVLDQQDQIHHGAALSMV